MLGWILAGEGVAARLLEDAARDGGLLVTRGSHAIGLAYRGDAATISGRHTHLGRVSFFDVSGEPHVFRNGRTGDMGVAKVEMADKEWICFAPVVASTLLRPLLGKDMDTPNLIEVSPTLTLHVKTLVLGGDGLEQLVHCGLSAGKSVYNSVRCLTPAHMSHFVHGVRRVTRTYDDIYICWEARELFLARELSYWEAQRRPAQLTKRHKTLVRMAVDRQLGAHAACAPPLAAGAGMLPAARRRVRLPPERLHTLDINLFKMAMWRFLDNALMVRARACAWLIPITSATLERQRRFQAVAAAR